jgi:soluble lytic murein transglycosylase-like protein
MLWGDDRSDSRWSLAGLGDLLLVAAFVAATALFLQFRAMDAEPPQADHAAQVQAYGQAITDLQEEVRTLRAEVAYRDDILSLRGVPPSTTRALRRVERATGLPPGIMPRLVTVESSWRPQAVSSKRALGLAQVKLSTARTIDPEITREELMQPAVNVTVGAVYLVRLLNRYDGDLRAALRAYNAGPTNVDRWAARGVEVSGAYADKVLR